MTASAALGTQKDGALVAAVLTGDELAACELFHRYQPRLVRRMRYWTRDQGRADDLAQDAWLNAMAALERFEQVAPFWPWLRCIADNVARSDLRSRLLPSGDERVIVVDDECFVHTPVLIDDTARVDDGECLVGALRAIPARQREAFLAVAHAGAPAAVAPAAFGVNENAFRQLYHRARSNLQYRLEGAFATAPVLWWYRVRAQVRNLLEGVQPVGVAHGVAVVAGVVAVVVLAPMVDDDARASLDSESVRAVDSPSQRELNRDRTANTRVSDPWPQRPADTRRERPTFERGSTTSVEGATAPGSPVVRAPSVAVDGVRVRGHQEAPRDPDVYYGVVVDAPGVPRQKVGHQAEDSDIAPVHEAACTVAVSTPVTYCDS